MSWRSVVISKPSILSLYMRALRIEQEGETAHVPLEDIAALVLDQPQITLSAALLAACAEANIVVITVGETHLPNGVLLSFLPHSRALKVMQAQLDLTQPARKRLRQMIVRQKIVNQAEVIAHTEPIAAKRLRVLASRVRSGDPENCEAQAAQVYFRSLFLDDFTRQQNRFYNAALNYGYAIIRSAIARSLTAYGFLPAFGIFHHSELNAFNLADDLFEPFRPLIDRRVLQLYPAEPQRELMPADKGNLVRILHEDVRLTSHLSADSHCSALAAVDALVSSFSSIVIRDREVESLTLPCLSRQDDDSADPELDLAES